MKERQILFSGSMVNAILDGQKSQTRRVVKPQPETMRDPFPTTPETMMADGYSCNLVFKIKTNPGCYTCLGMRNFVEAFSPYGQPGDQLWVRETFWDYGRWEQRFNQKKDRLEWHFIDLTVEMDRLYQYSDPTPDNLRRHRREAMQAWWKRPAIFMHRVASRIQLEIVSERVERLHDITPEDALAEGVMQCDFVNELRGHYSADELFSALWESINGTGSWYANPWVWVIEFRRIEP